MRAPPPSWIVRETRVEGGSSKTSVSSAPPARPRTTMSYGRGHAIRVLPCVSAFTQAMVLDIFWVMMGLVEYLIELVIGPAFLWSHAALGGIHPIWYLGYKISYYFSAIIGAVGGVCGFYVELPFVSTAVYMQLGPEQT